MARASRPFPRRPEVRYPVTTAAAAHNSTTATVRSAVPIASVKATIWAGSCGSPWKREASTVPTTATPRAAPISRAAVFSPEPSPAWWEGSSVTTVSVSDGADRPVPTDSTSR